MVVSNLLFLTSDQLREEFSKCPNDVNKRILIIDVRNVSSYERSHLCLDRRNDISSIKTKMRVMNIDPNRMKSCTAKNIMSILSDDDLRVFGKRRDATEVIVIDKDTDNLQKLSDPKSKVMRLINALTKYDNQSNNKIIVPIHILKGGFREWLNKYPHFTTDPQYDPDAEDDDLVDTTQGTLDLPRIPLTPTAPPIEPIVKPPPPLPPTKPPQLPQPKTPLPPPPSTLSVRPTLPRSYSSPNVAGEDQSLRPPDHLPTEIAHKPTFNRALKPRINNDAINSMRAQLNFGRSPEASGKAISGLQNLGNTCFMNSVIQCLAYIPSLVDYFCSDGYYAHINLESQYGSNGELAVEFGALLEKLNSHRYRYIEPRSFRETVTKHIGFAGNEQQDSHEFMMMLFDKLHHDLNLHAQNSPMANGTSNNDSGNTDLPREELAYQFWTKHLQMNRSYVSDQFEGIFMSTLTCTFCRSQSNTFEVFNCLSLPIPSETRCHLKDCLNHFSNPERIDAVWECPKCKQKREADKKIVICKLPKILVIHLKRFSLEGRWRSKLQTTVDFPLNHLKVEGPNVLPQFASELQRPFYLCAVVNHYGHLDGGHYTAFCKLRNWYTFDDSNVTEMSEADVCGQSAYILFYVNQD